MEKQNQKKSKKSKAAIIALSIIAGLTTAAAIAAPVAIWNQYKDKQTPTVEDPIKSVTIGKNAQVTEYTVGQTINLSGLSIVGTLQSGKTRDIALSECTITPAIDKQLALTDNKVTITYKEFTPLEYAITVSDDPSAGKEIEKLEWVVKPSKTQYKVFEKLNVDDMRLFAIYKDGMSKELNKTECKFTPSLDTILDETITEVTVEYKNVQAEKLNINVVYEGIKPTIQKDDNISVATHTKIEVDESGANPIIKSFTITPIFKDGYKLDTATISINNKSLTENTNFTVSNNVITVNDYTISSATPTPTVVITLTSLDKSTDTTVTAEEYAAIKKYLFVDDATTTNRNFTVDMDYGEMSVYTYFTDDRENNLMLGYVPFQGETKTINEAFGGSLSISDMTTKIGKVYKVLDDTQQQPTVCLQDLSNNCTWNAIFEGNDLIEQMDEYSLFTYSNNKYTREYTRTHNDGSTTYVKSELFFRNKQLYMNKLYEKDEVETEYELQTPVYKYMDYGKTVVPKNPQILFDNTASAPSAGSKLTSKFNAKKIDSWRQLPSYNVVSNMNEKDFTFNDGKTVTIKFLDENGTEIPELSSGRGINVDIYKNSSELQNGSDYSYDSTTKTWTINAGVVSKTDKITVIVELYESGGTTYYNKDITFELVSSAS